MSPKCNQSVWREVALCLTELMPNIRGLANPNWAFLITEAVKDFSFVLIYLQNIDGTL